MSNLYFNLGLAYDRKKNIDFVKVKKDASGLNIKSHHENSSGIV